MGVRATNRSTGHDSSPSWARAVAAGLLVVGLLAQTPARTLACTGETPTLEEITVGNHLRSFGVGAA